MSSSEPSTEPQTDHALIVFGVVLLYAIVISGTFLLGQVLHASTADIWRCAGMVTLLVLGPLATNILLVLGKRLASPRARWSPDRAS
jgi:cytochrome c biogenesis protein CcdA